MNRLPDATLAHLRRVMDWPVPPGDRYEVREPLGQGGMGTVYLARDRALGRDVALKVLRGDLADRGSALRIEREARILARLEHPGIVPVHDVGMLADGRVYYVMKLVRGARLDEFARATSLAEVLRTFLRICETVGFAHARGVVHRDLKPSNIMVGPFGEVLVLDWGIARVQEPGAESADPETASPLPGTTGETDEDDTAPGTVMGTPGFMAPEQASGQVHLVDARSDVFSLGAILEEVVRAGGAASEAPRPLAAIWGRASAGDPGERYQTAAELAADVARFLDAQPVLAYREPALERLARLYQKYQTPILLVLAYLTMRLLFLVARGF